MRQTGQVGDKMLKGIDVSRYQKTLKDFSKYDFVIIKATEGVTYTDPCLDQHYNNLHGSTDGKPDTKKLYGFYHFARPENNDAIAEAKHFLSKVGHHAGNALFVLDWEATALRYNISWAKKWMDYVYEQTGVRPLIYCSGSYTKNLKPLLNANYGLWVAHYNVSKPTTGVYPTYALWQYTSKPLDMNYFNGTATQFKAYCKKVKK